MKRRKYSVPAVLLAFHFLLAACPNGGGENEPVTPPEETIPPELTLEDQKSAGELAALFDASGGFPAELSNSWKIWGHRNPLYTQAFGADPNALVYGDRVYLYMSNDTLEYTSGGQLNPNASYGLGIQGIRMASSADLANWTDHGAVNIVGPANTNPLVEDWTPLVSIEGVDRSWAPSAAWKMINGRPKFFMYWGNGGNGIGVVSADSPTGPWASPLDRLLVDRSTPNCADVHYLFDPSVLVDNDNQGYLYFGGGDQFTPPFNNNNTGHARRVKLSYNMIGLEGVPEYWLVPYLFEASDMKKINGYYYFSYSTLNNVAGNTFGLLGTQIAYMMSPESPLGPFTDPKGILVRQLASADTNVHGAMFEFKGKTYYTYHAQKAAEAMGVTRMRSPHIDSMPVNSDGSIPPITMTRKGVEQAGYLNPYAVNEAETIGIQGGIYTRPAADAGNGMLVTSIDTGDWLAVYGVDFGGEGASKFTARVRTPAAADYSGAIELRLDPEGAGETGDTGNLTPANTARITGGEVIGRVWIKAKPGESGKYGTVTADLDRAVTGVHDLVFVFYTSTGVNPETIVPDSRHKDCFEFDQWQFIH